MPDVFSVADITSAARLPCPLQRPQGNARAAALRIPGRGGAGTGKRDQAALS